MLVRAARESETRKSSPAAADLMLRARALTLKPRSRENFAQIETLWRQALALEPDNITTMLSLAGVLATSANNFGFSMGDALREKKFVEARELARKVIAVDPERSAVHAVLAMYASAHDDYPEAVNAAERQLSLNPKSPQAHNLLASILVRGGDPRRAVALCHKAMALDPLHVSELVWANQGWAYMQLGEYDKAIEALNRSLEKNPSLVVTQSAMVLAHSLKGDEAKARALAADLLRNYPDTKLERYRRLGATIPQSYKDLWRARSYPRGAGLDSRNERRAPRTRSEKAPLVVCQDLSALRIKRPLTMS